MSIDLVYINLKLKMLTLNIPSLRLKKLTESFSCRLIKNPMPTFSFL